MRRIKLLLLAIASLICAVAVHSALHAAQRPRYGGTLRVEMRERVNSMDPRGFDLAAPGAQATERLLRLVYDRLVRIDERGQAQPALAFSWQHDASFTHWQFQIRPDVKFHDDTKLNAEVAAAALQAQDWPAITSGSAVTFAFASPRPNLAVELASGRSFIFHPAEDTVFGTGAFRIAEWQAGQKLALIASEEYWAGRPFVDRAEIALGIAPQQQIIDLELGHADVIEVLPTLARRAGQTSARLWNSSPVDLFAITFAPGHTAAQDPRLAQSLSLAIDRAAIVNVILQRQGEPAASLLPQWLSGYAFLFPTAPNLEQARQLRAQVPAIRALSLVYDGGDPVAATVAERFAVNARDLGIAVSVSAAKAGAASPNADLRLVRWHVEAPDSQQALGALLARVSQPLAAAQVGGPPVAASPALDTPEQRYAAERAALDGGSVIPLAFVPEIYALGPNVRDWMAPRWGGWRLEDVWLDLTPKAEQAAGGNNRP
jgi:peptide/nickel transport system substrate-binding protein